MIFRDRTEAGQKLALALQEYKEDPDAIVIALPRGGVVVGFEVARRLKLPLDIVSPRKIGAPFNPELAIGAITETGEGVYSSELIEQLAVSEEFIAKAVDHEKKVAKERLEHYRKHDTPRALEGKRVLIVDDGLATGSTMRAAIQTVRAEKAREIIMAIPVAPPDTLDRLSREVDRAVCLATPPSFFAVGQFYESFEQTTDAEVIALLRDIR